MFLLIQELLNKNHKSGHQISKCGRSRRRKITLEPAINNNVDGDSNNSYKSCPNERLILDNHSSDNNSTMEATSKYHHRSALYNRPHSTEFSAQPLYRHRLTLNPSWFWSILVSLMLILVLDSFSHQLLHCAAQVSPRSGDDVEMERLIRGNGNNLKNNINHFAINKVFHHNRSTLTISTTTTSTTRPAKLKGGSAGSKGGTKTKQKSRPKPIKGKNNNKARQNGNVSERINETQTGIVNHGNNWPKYMKIPNGNQENYYLSTVQISTSTSSPTANIDSKAKAKAPIKLPMTWAPSAPDVSGTGSGFYSNWKGSNRPSSFQNGFTFSTTTSRSMSMRLQPSYQQHQKQSSSQLDPLSVLQIKEGQSTTTTTTTEGPKNDTSGVPQGRHDADDDDDDEPHLMGLGRSNLDFGTARSPIYERPTGKVPIFTSTSSSGITSGKKLTANFFDNFEDHWDDPIADETKGSEMVIRTVTGPSAGGNTQFTSVPSSAPPDVHLRGQQSRRPPAATSHELDDKYGTTGTGPSASAPSEPQHGYLNPPTLQNYPPHYHFHPGSLNNNEHKNSYYSAHKNVNYWPQKLNSYYGDHVTSQVVQHAAHHSQRPTLHNPLTKHRFPSHHPPPQMRPHPQNFQRPGPPFMHPNPPKHGFPFPQKGPVHPTTAIGATNSLEDDIGGTAPGPTLAFEDQGSGDQYIGSESNPLQKVTMIDRVSTFYTEYKLLAWGGILLLISFGVLVAIVALYMNNPPTEVVTAKRDLVSRLSDPAVLKFLERLIEGDDDGGNYGTERFKTLSNGTTIEGSSNNGTLQNSKVKTRRKRRLKES